MSVQCPVIQKHVPLDKIISSIRKMIHSINHLTSTSEFCSVDMLVTNSINTRLEEISCSYKCVRLFVFKLKVAVTKLEGTISTLHLCDHKFYLLFKISISLCDKVYHKSTMVFTAVYVYDLVQH